MTQMDIHQAVAVLKNGIPPGQAGKFEVMCDDGATVLTDWRHLYMSSLFFTLNEKYNLPIMSRHLIDTTIGSKSISTSTVPDHLSKYAKDIIVLNRYDGAETLKAVAKDIIQTNNHVHNVMTEVSMSSQRSVSILSLLEVIHHPVMEDIYHRVTTGEISIKDSYTLTSKFLNTTPDLSDNSVIRAVRTKMANENQIMQVLMVRGYPTEVNGDIMPIPVMTNFTRGIRKVYDYVAESRSAAKSYYFTDEPLKKSEYFARRLQLIAMSVERIHYGVDCGSQTFLRWPSVRGPEKDEGGDTIYPGDLNFMMGKYYWCETDNQLKIINGSETHLYGKPLLMRSSITCQHEDAAGVCEVCFGELARNIPPTSNIGHTSGCVMTQQTTQSTMGTKHLDASSVAVRIILEEAARNYFKDPDKHQVLKLKPSLMDKGLTMTLDKDQARGITDLQYIDDISNLNHSRTTAVINALMRHTENGRVIENLIRVAQTSRRGYLSKDFLYHVKKHGYTMDDKGNFVFDLTHWNFKLPVFQYTKREQNYSQHGQEIAMMIESSVSQLADREKPDSPQQTLYELFNLVNSKLSVHLSCLEIIIYAIMIPEKGNYALARGAKSPILGVYNQIMANRSLSAMYVFENLRSVVLNPESFKKGNRPDHPLDVLFDPKGVVEHMSKIADVNRRYVHPKANWPND